MRHRMGLFGLEGSAWTVQLGYANQIRILHEIDCVPFKFSDRKDMEYPLEYPIPTVSQYGIGMEPEGEISIPFK